MYQRCVCYFSLRIRCVCVAFFLTADLSAQGTWKEDLRQFTSTFNKCGVLHPGDEVLFFMPGDETLTIYIKGREVCQCPCMHASVRFCALLITNELASARVCVRTFVHVLVRSRLRTHVNDLE